MTETLEETAASPSNSAAQDSDRKGLKVTLISLHGLIRAREPELGRDADTGGQVILTQPLPSSGLAHSSATARTRPRRGN